MKNTSSAMMLTRIQRLQEAATSDSASVPELLRLAWVVAVGLGLEEKSSWIVYELNGYPEGSLIHDLPKYRRLQAELVADNSPWGWIPFVLKSDGSDFLLQLPLVGLSTSVTALTLATTNNEDLISPLQDEINRLLRREPTSFDDSPIRAGRKLRSHQLKQVLEEVRSRILDWALKVEDLIDAQREPFSELQVPITNNFHIQSAQGIFGSTSHSTINQTNSMNQDRFNALAATLRENNVNEDDIRSLQDAIQADPPSPSDQSELGPRVQMWIGKMLLLAGTATWSITANAAGSLLAAAIGNYYGWS